MTRITPRRTLRGGGRLVLVGLLLLGILIAAVYMLVSYLQVDEIALPDVRGMPYAQAVGLLRDLELEPVTYSDNVQGVPVEAVTSQTPGAGAVVRRGRSVSLGVNRPPEAASAPVLTGLTEAQAASTAAALNMRVGRIEYVNSEQAAGRVIEQTPQAGHAVAAGGGIDLVVSRGPALPPIELPDLTGLPVRVAEARLRELGLRTVSVVATGVTFDSPGTVKRQDPAPGEELSASTPVRLEYELSAREVVQVPDLSGRDATSAARLLRAAGLRLGELAYVENPELPRGTIATFSPSGYTLRGSPVSLTVNAASGTYDHIETQFAGEDDLRAAEEPGRTRLSDLFGNREEDVRDDEQTLVRGGADDAGEEIIEDGGRRVNVAFDPATLGVRSLQERDYDLRLVVQDERGERTVLERRARAGESIDASIVVYGDALLQTFINDIFFQAWRP